MKKILSFIIVGALFSFLLFNILNNWKTINSFPWKFEIGNLIFLIILILPLYFLNILGWHFITRALGAKVSFARNMYVWMISNLSRFLPGGFWQYPGRVYLFKKEGSSLVLATTAVVVEILLNLLVASFLALTYFVFSQYHPQTQSLRPIFAVIIIFAVILLTLTNSNLMTAFASIIKRGTGKGDILKEIKLPLRWIPLLVGIFFLQNLAAGSVLFFLSRGAIDLPFSLFLLFVGIFSASWLLGYVTLLAPSGLGVQEASITFLLSHYMPFAVAAVIAILFRILLLISELIMLLVVFFLYNSNLNIFIDIKKPNKLK